MIFNIFLFLIMLLLVLGAISVACQMEDGFFESLMWVLVGVLVVGMIHLARLVF